MSAKYEIIIGDITKTKFNDNEFDAVLTLSLMEHLSDLDGAMKELSRIIKKDGYLFIFFGPAWSNAYGHHIYAEPGDKLLDFSSWKMPSHLHLLFTKEEIREFYINNGYTEAQCDCVLHWFYETQLINRILFEDYLKVFRLHFTLLASDIMYNNIDHSTLQKLKQKNPGYSDFTSYGGKFLLKNNLK